MTDTKIIPIHFLVGTEKGRRDLDELILANSPFDGMPLSEGDTIFGKLFRQLPERDEVSFHIKNKYLYYSNDSVVAYVYALDAMKECYSVEQELAINAIKHLLLSKSGACFNYVSIGSGTGKKDYAVLKSLNESSARINKYVPLDASVRLLQKTICYFNAHKEHKVNETIPFCCDLYDLEQGNLEMFLHSTDPNIFVVLGGTMGNHQEKEFLQQVHSWMRPCDYLLITVELYCKQTSKRKRMMLQRYNSQANALFLLSPLRIPPIFRGFVDCSSTVFSFKADTLDFRENKSLKISNVPDTQIFAPEIMSIAPATGGGKATTLYSTWATKYDQSALEAFWRTNGFETEWQSKETKGQVCYCLKLKRTDAKSEENIDKPNQPLPLK